jgi:hypothetical protein
MGSNTPGGTYLLRRPDQLPLLFPGQPRPPLDQEAVPPFQSGGGDGDAFDVFSSIFLRETTPTSTPSGNNPFLVQTAVTAGNIPFPPIVGTEEMGSNTPGGTDLLRRPDQLPMLFPGQPRPPLDRVAPPFQSGGSDGDGFDVFSNIFLKEDPPGGNLDLPP